MNMYGPTIQGTSQEDRDLLRRQVEALECIALFLAASHEWSAESVMGRAWDRVHTNVEEAQS